MRTPVDIQAVTSDDLRDFRRDLAEVLVRLGIRYQPTIVTKDYTFTDKDEIASLQVDATAGNVTVTLPSPTGFRRRRIVKTDNGTNTVTIQPGTGITIAGYTNYTLRQPQRFIEVEPTGTGWLVTAYGLVVDRPEGSTFVGTGGPATTATDGFLYVPCCTGAPTGVPNFVGGGWRPIVIDDTNHKLYFYSGGAWRDAGP